MKQVFYALGQGYKIFLAVAAILAVQLFGAGKLHLCGAILVGAILTFLGARHLNILQLGDETAKGLGLRVDLVRSLLTAVAALLAASAVCVVGLLGFVGLIIPHTARLLIGSDYRFLLPASALLGAAVLTISDTFARTIFAPTELPVGILMAILGAPFFLFLLRREL